MQELNKIITQDLDDYSLELNACLHLNNIDETTLIMFKRKLERVLNACNSIINN